MSWITLLKGEFSCSGRQENSSYAVGSLWFAILKAALYRLSKKYLQALDKDFSIKKKEKFTEFWLGTRTGAGGTTTLVWNFFWAQSPWLHGQQTMTLIISDRRDWRDTRGKWPLARNPDRSWWHRHTSFKLFWPRPPWLHGQQEEITPQHWREGTIVEIKKRGISVYMW